MEKQKDKRVEEKEKSVEVTESSKIYYKSNVTVRSVTASGKTLKSFNKHNTAQKPLFSFFLNCLANNYESNACPEYAYPLFYPTGLSGDVDSTKILVGSAASVISKKSVSENETPNINLSIMITANKMIKSGYNVLGIALFSPSNSSVIASSTEENIKWDNVKSDSSMFVLFDKLYEQRMDENLLVAWSIQLSDEASVVKETNSK